MQPVDTAPAPADLAKWMAEHEEYNRLVSFRRHHVLPPTGLYVTVDDVLVLTALSPIYTLQVNVSVRLLTPDGQVIPQYYNFANMVASGNAYTRIMRLAEGYVLSATLETPLMPAGAAFVMLSVKRGTGSQDATQGDLLVSGSPGVSWQIGYPQSTPVTPSSVVGMTRSFSVANPAAGADFYIGMQAGTSTMPISVTANFATSAAVGNRIPALVLTDGPGNVLFSGVCVLAQAASLTWTYTWSAQPVTPPTGGTQNQGPLPPGMRIPSGGFIKSVTAGIQAGDQWSAIQMTITQYVAS